jgi:hypothetical protein
MLGRANHGNDRLELGRGPHAPVGHDVVVGLWVGLLRAIGNDKRRLALLAKIAAAAIMAAERTTLGSRSYIEAAAQGEVSERRSYRRRLRS